MIRLCIIERPWRRQRGQTFLVIVVFIAVFLLAVLGLATDYTQVWAHRQMAQGAADAACQAAAADLFLNAISPSSSGQNGLQPFSWIGSSFDCSTNAGSPPCAYAALNGYSGSMFSVTFRVHLRASLPSWGFGTVANPYVKSRSPIMCRLSFTKLASSPTQNVKYQRLGRLWLESCCCHQSRWWSCINVKRRAVRSWCCNHQSAGRPKRSIQVRFHQQARRNHWNGRSSQGWPRRERCRFWRLWRSFNKNPQASTWVPVGNWVQPSRSDRRSMGHYRCFRAKPANAGTATTNPVCFQRLSGP